MCHTRNHGRKMIKFPQDLHKLKLRKFCTDMRKIYLYWQGRIYAHIFQIIWQCKKNFHKSTLGISKWLFFLFKYIVESSVDWFLRKQSEILWKCLNFTPIDYKFIKFLGSKNAAQKFKKGITCRTCTQWVPKISLK